MHVAKDINKSDFFFGFINILRGYQFYFKLSVIFNCIYKKKFKHSSDYESKTSVFICFIGKELNLKNKNRSPLLTLSEKYQN